MHEHARKQTEGSLNCNRTAIEQHAALQKNSPKVKKYQSAKQGWIKRAKVGQLDLYEA